MKTSARLRTSGYWVSYRFFSAALSAIWPCSIPSPRIERTLRSSSGRAGGTAFSLPKPDPDATRLRSLPVRLVALAADMGGDRFCEATRVVDWAVAEFCWGAGRSDMRACVSETVCECPAGSRILDRGGGGSE